MKAVMASIPPDLSAFRSKTGADRWDESWKGVLHMTPMPNREHQDLEGAMETWLRTHWTKPRGAKVYHNVNVASVGGWPHDYRIPDLVLLTPDRFGIDKNEYFEGPPTIGVEIRSPDDETYDKLPWYAALGIPEIWVIDRDTKTPELFALKSGKYRKQAPGPTGWLVSAHTGIHLRATGQFQLTLKLGNDESTQENLP